MMEKMLQVILLGIVFTLAGCSSDDNGPGNGLSEEQLNALAGNWMLVEYNVNPPQDLNEDDTQSVNLIDELDCISATLTVAKDLSWNISAIQVTATAITNGEYAVFCESTSTDSGQWRFENNELSLYSDGNKTSLILSGNQLTQTPDEDLPGVKQLVYQKL
jgi:hypothetical protein